MHVVMNFHLAAECKVLSHLSAMLFPCHLISKKTSPIRFLALAGQEMNLTVGNNFVSMTFLMNGFKFPGRLLMGALSRNIP